MGNGDVSGGGQGGGKTPYGVLSENSVHFPFFFIPKRFKFHVNVTAFVMFNYRKLP